MLHKENMRYSKSSKTLDTKSRESLKRTAKEIGRPLTPPESLHSRKCYQQINLNTPEAIPLSKLFLKFESLANLSRDILMRDYLSEEVIPSSYHYTTLQVLLQDAEEAENILLALGTTDRISQSTQLPPIFSENV